MSGLRDKILSFDDVEVRNVTVPEWGDLTVELRTPSVRARGELVGLYMNGAQVDYVRMYPALIVATAFDPETGEQLFTNDDITALTEKSSRAMERLANVAMELAGMGGDQGIEELKDSSTPILNSLTDSP